MRIASRGARPFGLGQPGKSATVIGSKASGNQRLHLSGYLQATWDQPADVDNMPDGSWGTCEGVFSIDFHRAAESLEFAISSAINNVESAGFEVERVEIRAGALPVSAS
jgi:hypothetical protein